MANVVDYLTWRGDIELTERPFNDVDNLVLATISYLDFGGIVPAPGEGSIALGKACQIILDETKGDVSQRVRSFAKLTDKFLVALAASRRFSTMMLHDYVDELDVETFAAASVADATTVFASSVVSSGVRLAPICASAVAMPVKMLPMSAIVPLDVLPVNGMRMP